MGIWQVTSCGNIKSTNMAENQDAIMERELQKIPPDERSRRAKKIQDELEAWKNVEVKLAVIGGTGVGKSTYINRMRGVTYKDKDTKDSRGQNLYAPVGLNETTMEIKEYEYQDNPLIR